MELREYQKRTVQRCLRNPRLYLALDMGLGKTAIMLHTIKELKVQALIIAPLRTIYTTWPSEIKKWGLDLKVSILHGKDKTINFNKKADIYLINPEGIAWLYDTMVKYRRSPVDTKNQVLIFDEGSLWKSPSTKRFKIMKNLTEVFHDRVYILSGTPAPNSLLDLWSQYYLLDQGKTLGSSFYGFKNRFFRPVSWNKFEWVYKSDSSKQDIYNLIEPLTVRLDKEDYLKLPPFISNEVVLEMPSNIKKEYKKIESDFFFKIDESEVEVFNAASLSSKLRQYIQGGMYINAEHDWKTIHTIKLQALKELVEELEGSNILLALQFRFEVELIKSVFPDTPVIAGGVSVKESTDIINRWNEKKVPLLICHPGSISHGVNLQGGANNIIWYGLTWSLEQYQQFNARLHRSGQTKPVIAHHFILKETVDEKIYKALQRKHLTQKELLDYLRG